MAIGRSAELCRRDLLYLIAALGIACLCTLLIRFEVGFSHQDCEAVSASASLSGIAIALPIMAESALFIHLHPFVVVGQVLDWLTTALAAAVTTAYWLAS